MMIFRSRAAGTLAAAAALSLTATPAMAHGWHHHDDGVDSGDLLAGLLIVGGIAAIAIAASHSAQHHQADTDQDDGDYPDQPDRPDGNTYRPEPNRFDNYVHVPPIGDDYRDDSGYAAPTVSADSAVDACVGAMESGQSSVGGIDTVNREGNGWRIAGRDRDGRDFACSVDREGHIRRVVGA
jgi:hypothetical protein